MTNERLTYQQVRARLVRAALAHPWGRQWLIVTLWKLGEKRKITPTHTDTALAYMLAWRLLPPGPTRASRGTSTRIEQTPTDSLLSALLSADLSARRQGKEGANDAR